MARTLIRPGGRSERIQSAVHDAVRALMAERPDAELSIAVIAARAEVPPSTIYRRWHTLQQLLADVAAERFMADSEPPNTGSLQGDLEIWLEQFVDDIASGPGHALLRERIHDIAASQRAAGYAFMNMVAIVDRCRGRGEVPPEPDRLMDMIVAPVIYRIFFAGQPIEKPYQLELVQAAIGSPALAQPFLRQTTIRNYVLFEND